MVKLLIFIKHHLSFIWAIVEYFNYWIFTLLHGRRLRKCLPNVLVKNKNEYAFKLLDREDMPILEQFFSRQPASAFEFFKPHGFDLKSLINKNRDKSFIMIGTFCGDKLVGYCFIRCFFNGQAFRGKIVDKDFQGKGIAKQMGVLTSEICQVLGFRLFATISKDNVKSIASSKAVNEMRIVKELPDNYLYVEYILKDR